MIASFSRRFVFIKTRKTGGTSVEIVLSAWCSGADICAPITGEDELIRAEYGGKPMNFCTDADRAGHYMEAIRSGDAELIDAAYRRIRPHLRFRSHDPAEKVRAALPELWETAFKFSVDRHPYEKVISLAYWRVARRRGGNLTALAEVLDEAIEKGDYVNYPAYTSKGNLLLDAVYPYETVWEEIGGLAGRLGTSMPRILPRAKAQFRADRRPAREVLSADQKRRIAEKCALEFELLGYEP